MLAREKVADLRAKAEAATPGPWEQWVGHAQVFAGPSTENTAGHISGARGEICRCDSDEFGEDDDEGEQIAEANAAHIAAFDRETSLALCAAADALRELVDAITCGSVAPVDPARARRRFIVALAAARKALGERQ